MDRQNGLFSQGFISRQDVDTAQREYDLAMSSYNTVSLSLSLILEGAREQDIISARASVLKAEVSYEQATSDVKDALVYAPVSGTILEKNVEEGEKITSGIGNSSGGTVILTIGDLSTMRILTKINEVDITKVRMGQDVDITLDAIRGEKYHGRVINIASLGKVENNIVTYEVVVEIVEAESNRSEKLKVKSEKLGGRRQEARGKGQMADGKWQEMEDRRKQTGDRRQEARGRGQEVRSQEEVGSGQESEVRGQRSGERRQKADGRRQESEGREQERNIVQEISQTPSHEPRIPTPASSMKKLKTGMTADVDIITDKKTNVLYVPLEALLEHKGADKGILVLENSKFVPRKIKTGLQDETRVEIVEGLTEGEKVKLNGLTTKKKKTDSSNRPRMMGGPPGMGMGGMGRR